MLHLDKVLTGISVGYQNPAFVGELLAPTVRVDKQSDRYNVYEKSGFTVLDDIRAPKGRANEIPPRRLSRDTYFAEEHALVDMVAPEDSENADGDVNGGNLADDLADSTEELTNTIILNREHIVQTLARNPANYAPGHTVTLSGTSQWNDYANSDPIANVKAGRDKVHAAIYKVPNLGIFGYEVMSTLEDHPKFIDRIKYTVERGENSEGAIAALLGIPRIVRAEAVSNTAAVGLTVTTAYMWGKDAVLAWVPPRPNRRTPAFMYEFAWPYRGNIPGIRGNPVMPTERWWDNDHSAWKVRVRRRYDHKFIAVDSVATGRAVAGYLIRNARA